MEGNIKDKDGRGGKRRHVCARVRYIYIYKELVIRGEVVIVNCGRMIEGRI